MSEVRTLRERGAAVPPGVAAPRSSAYGDGGHGRVRRTGHRPGPTGQAGPGG
ncbi:hypothetical protein [Streptomyces sp. enrichment culture]|uniref:hypothetical protein n=1 Tax=Streptomyces sp. enrichment culture TaxID=1795815 RepID=UPI003F553C31